jgi:serine/threonine-protein kinase RsbW
MIHLFSETLKMIKVAWDLPAEAAYLSLTRRLIRSLLEYVDADQSDIREVEVILGEICTNVVRHAYTDPGNHYRVELELKGPCLTFTVTDVGRGFDRSVTISPRFTEQGGMGLWIAQQLADWIELRVEEGVGTVVKGERSVRLPNGVSSHTRVVKEPPPVEPVISIDPVSQPEEP